MRTQLLFAVDRCGAVGERFRWRFRRRRRPQRPPVPRHHRRPRFDGAIPLSGRRFRNRVQSLALPAMGTDLLSRAIARCNHPQGRRLDRQVWRLSKAETPTRAAARKCQAWRSWIASCSARWMFPMPPTGALGFSFAADVSGEHGGYLVGLAYGYPNPRTSMRPPAARHAVMCSSITFTASSTSRPASNDCLCVMRRISSDFVIGPLSHGRPPHEATVPVKTQWRRTPSFPARSRSGRERDASARVPGSQTRGTNRARVASGWRELPAAAPAPLL